MSLRAAVAWRRDNLHFDGKVSPKMLTRLRGDCFVGLTALLATTLLLTSCLPLNSTPPTVTPLPTNTAVPTQTIVWFPASATPTLLIPATYTATPEMNPGIGAVTLSDDFTNEKLWDVAASDQGSAAIAANSLSLAVQPGVYLASMRHNLNLGNFYAEITAHPSLCRGEDSYGLIVRSLGNSFYRFSISCDHMIHAERVSGGVKLQIQEPVASGDAPGAPGEVRIGMWAVGSEMRLFLNDRFQFSVIEKNFPSGGFGVFVKSEDTAPVSVTFADFKVYKVNYVPPTRTPLP